MGGCPGVIAADEVLTDARSLNASDNTYLQAHQALGDQSTSLYAHA